MGEIKRYAYMKNRYGSCIGELSTGEYVKHEDHLKAIAEAESAAVKRFLIKTLSFECKKVDCSECSNDVLLCGLNIVLRAYGVDEVIKKVEGL